MRRNPAILLLLGAALLLSSCGVSRRSGGAQPRSTSILTASDRHEAGEGNNLQAVLSYTVGQPGVVRPGVIFLGGDYVGKGPDRGRNGQPVFSVRDIFSEVEAAMGDGSPYKVLLTYGSHDRSCKEGADAFLTGPYKGDGYYLYGISHAQMAFDADSLTLSYNGLDADNALGRSAESATRSFLGWVRGLKDHDPIVVMSHVPMHAHRKDNRGGLKWFNALNEAAAGHDIILLFCHNHSMEERGDKADQAFYLLTPGEEISVQGPGEDEVVKGKLRFTYGNAGYLKLGWASLITYTDVDGNGDYDKVEIRRFNSLGEPDGEFGQTGKANPYTMDLAF